jgi:hypothetical protein
MDMGWEKAYYVRKNSIQTSFFRVHKHTSMLGSLCMSLNYCSAFSGLALGCQKNYFIFQNLLQ